MSFESDFRSVLVSLAGGRIYPDVPPDVPQFPYISYQQVGGRPLEFTEGSKPSHANARMQLDAWAKTRAEANALMRQAEALLRASAFKAQPLTKIVANYQPALKLYGARQDFGLWHPDP